MNKSLPVSPLLIIVKKLNARFLLLLSLVLLSSAQLFAAKISGTIKDAADNSPLIGVLVNIKGTQKAVTTDAAGHWEFNDIENGEYELNFAMVTYKKKTEKVTVTGGADVVLDITMAAEGSKELKSVNVSTRRATHTESAMLLEIRKSNTIVSGISAAQIQRSMDRNAADVVKRVPGVTVKDDKFICVRGLFDRYNDVWLNDAGAPSSEVDRKSFSFDLIPSGLIDRILVFKTPAPELPGDFAGGMVKIYTTSLPDKNQYSISLQTSYRSGSTGTDFNYNKRSSTDWLGYDNNVRSLPSGTPDMISKNDAGNNALTKAFGNDWIINTKKTPMDMRLTATASNVVKLGKVKLGNTFGLSYTSTSTSYNVERQEWDDATSEQYHYMDRESESKTSVGILDNAIFTKGNTKIEFKNLYNQTGSAKVSLRTDVVDSFKQVTPEKAYAMGYDSKATYTTQLTGTHKNSSDRRKYTWTLGYTDLFKNQPDLRRIRYNLGPDSQYKASIANIVDPVNGGGRFYAQLFEHVYSFNHQFNQKIKITDNFDIEMVLGNYIEYKSRSYAARVLGYTIAPGANAQTLTKLPINDIFADQNVGEDGKFKMDEITSASDKYSADNTLIASYLALNIPVGPRVKVYGGLRYEYNKQTLNGYVNLDTIHPQVTTKFLLPSVNITYNFNTKSLVRLAYGKTLNRPEFRESAPIYFYDFELSAGTYGALFPHTFAPHGDTLKVAQIQNLDARWEWYPTSTEMVQFGGFYKHFNDPIQQIIVPGSGSDSKAFTFANGVSAYTYGVEVDARKNLKFLDEKLGTKFFKSMSVVGNLTLSKGELTMDSSRIKDVTPKTTLQSQSPYVVNVGVFYQNDSIGVQGSILYNVYGPRLYAVGTSYDPSIGELPFHSLDIVLSKTIVKRCMITVGVQNLLDQSVRLVQDVDLTGDFGNKHDFNFKRYNPGRYFTVGLKVKF